MTPEVRAFLKGIAAVLDTGISLMTHEQLIQWQGVRWAIEMIDQELQEDDMALLTQLLREPVPWTVRSR